MNSKNLSKAINRMLAILLTAAMVAGSFTVPVKAVEGEPAETESVTEEVTATQDDVKDVVEETPEPASADGATVEGNQGEGEAEDLTDPVGKGGQAPADLSDCIIFDNENQIRDLKATYTGVKYAKTTDAEGLTFHVNKPAAVGEGEYDSTEYTKGYKYYKKSSEGVYTRVDKDDIIDAGTYGIGYVIALNDSSYAGEKIVDFVIDRYDVTKASALDSVFSITWTDLVNPGVTPADNTKIENSITVTGAGTGLEYNGNAVQDANIWKVTADASTNSDIIIKGFKSGLEELGADVSTASTVDVKSIIPYSFKEGTDKVNSATVAGSDALKVEFDTSVLKNFTGKVELDVSIGLRPMTDVDVVDGKDVIDIGSPVAGANVDMFLYDEDNASKCVFIDKGTGAYLKPASITIDDSVKGADIFDSEATVGDDVDKKATYGAYLTGTILTSVTAASSDVKLTKITFDNYVADGLKNKTFAVTMTKRNSTGEIKVDPVTVPENLEYKGSGAGGNIAGFTTKVTDSGASDFTTDANYSVKAKLYDKATGKYVKDLTINKQGTHDIGTDGSVNMVLDTGDDSVESKRLSIDKTYQVVVTYTSKSGAATDPYIIVSSTPVDVKLTSGKYTSVAVNNAALSPTYTADSNGYEFGASYVGAVGAGSGYVYTAGLVGENSQVNFVRGTDYDIKYVNNKAATTMTGYYPAGEKHISELPEWKEGAVAYNQTTTQSVTSYKVGQPYAVITGKGNYKDAVAFVFFEIAQYNPTPIITAKDTEFIGSQTTDYTITLPAGNYKDDKGSIITEYGYKLQGTPTGAIASKLQDLGDGVKISFSGRTATIKCKGLSTDDDLSFTVRPEFTSSNFVANADNSQDVTVKLIVKDYKTLKLVNNSNYTETYKYKKADVDVDADSKPVIKEDDGTAEGASISLTENTDYTVSSQIYVSTDTLTTHVTDALTNTGKKTLYDAATKKTFNNKTYVNLDPGTPALNAAISANGDGPEEAGDYIIVWTYALTTTGAGKYSFGTNPKEVTLPYTIEKFDLGVEKWMSGADNSKVALTKTAAAGSTKFTRYELDKADKYIATATSAKIYGDAIVAESGNAGVCADLTYAVNPTNSWSTHLTHGTDFTCSIKRDAEPKANGCYDIYVTLKGTDKNYTGTRELKFEDAIYPTTVSGVTLALNNGTNAKWTGSAIKPDVHNIQITLADSTTKKLYVGKDTATKKADLVDDDFQITFENNVNVGTSTAKYKVEMLNPVFEKTPSTGATGTFTIAAITPSDEWKENARADITVDYSDSDTVTEAKTIILPMEINGQKVKSYNASTGVTYYHQDSGDTIFVDYSGHTGNEIGISDNSTTGAQTVDFVLKNNAGKYDAAINGKTAVYKVSAQFENYGTQYVYLAFTANKVAKEKVSLAFNTSETNAFKAATNLYYNHAAVDTWTSDIGKAKFPKVEVGAAGVSATVKYYEKDTADNGFKLMTSVPINAGTYRAVASIDNASYYAEEASFDFTIAPVTITKGTAGAGEIKVANLSFADGDESANYTGKAIEPKTYMTVKFSDTNSETIYSYDKDADNKKSYEVVPASGTASDLVNASAASGVSIEAKAGACINGNYIIAATDNEPKATFYIDKLPVKLSMSDLKVKVDEGQLSETLTYEDFDLKAEGLLEDIPHGITAATVVGGTVTTGTNTFRADNSKSIDKQDYYKEAGKNAFSVKTTGADFKISNLTLKSGDTGYDVTSNYDIEWKDAKNNYAYLEVTDTPKTEATADVKILADGEALLTGNKVYYTGKEIAVTFEDASSPALEIGKDYDVSVSPSTVKEKGDYIVTITPKKTSEFNVTAADPKTFSVIEKPPYKVTKVNVTSTQNPLLREESAVVTYEVKGTVDEGAEEDITEQAAIDITPATSDNFTVTKGEAGKINVTAKAGAEEGKSETFTITAGDGEDTATATFTLTVKPPFVVGNVKLSRTSLRLDPGAYENITYTVKDTEGNDVTGNIDVSLEGALGSPITAAMTGRGTVKVAVASDADVKATNSFKVVCQGTEFATLNVSIKGGSGEPDPGTPVEEPSEYEKPGEKDYIDIAEAIESATAPKTAPKYTGKPVEPKITVKAKTGYKLVAGTDYKVTYANNINAVTANAAEEEGAIAIVSGIGQYTGSVPVYFSIDRKKLGGTVVAGAVEKPEEGKPSADDIEEAISVYDGTKLLNYGDDYEIEESITEGKGKYDFVITYKGNYTGTKKASVKMAVKNDLALCDVEVMFGDKYEATYTGKAFTVKNGNMSIKVTDPDEKDVTAYSVSYKNNTNVGVGTVTLKGKKPYAGSKVVRFTINRNEDDESIIKANSITVNNGKAMTYTGKLLKPSVKVQATVNNKTKTLSKNKDYVVYYSSELNASTDTSTGCVIIRPIGNYEGQEDVVKEFTINKADFKKTSIKKNSEKRSGIYFNGKKLVAGEDFIAAAPVVDSKGKYTVTITVAEDSTNFIGSAVKTIKGTAAQIDWNQLYEVDDQLPPTE